MAWLANKKTTAKHVALFVAALVLFGVGPLPAPIVGAAELAQRSITISDIQASQSNVTYMTRFTTGSTGLIGSVRIQFCSNTSLLEDAVCTPPVGFNAGSAVLATQAGINGFSISGASTANDIILTRPPANESASTAAIYEFTGVTNQSVAGSSFARIFTYPTSDGSGPYADGGGFAIYYRPSFGVSAEVPPYLRFCVGESITGFDCTTATEPFSDVGILSPQVTGLAQSQMVAATNADGGYSIWVIGGTMTSGNNTLPVMTGNPSVKGTSQFGINLRANTSPVIGQDPAGPGAATVSGAYSVQNQFRYQSGDLLATAPVPDSNKRYTVSYVVNVAAGQPGGVYATTLTYIALANF